MTRSYTESTMSVHMYETVFPLFGNRRYCWKNKLKLLVHQLFQMMNVAKPLLFGFYTEETRRARLYFPASYSLSFSLRWTSSSRGRPWNWLITLRWMLLIKSIIIKQILNFSNLTDHSCRLDTFNTNKRWTLSVYLEDKYQLFIVKTIIKLRLNLFKFGARQLRVISVPWKRFVVKDSKNRIDG